MMGMMFDKDNDFHLKCVTFFPHFWEVYGFVFSIFWIKAT